MAPDPFDLRDTFLPDFIQEWGEAFPINEIPRLKRAGDGRQVRQRLGGLKVAKGPGITQRGFPVLRDLHGKESLVDGMAQAVDNPGAVDVQTHGRLMNDG